MIFEDIQGLVMSHTTGTSYELEFRAFIHGYKENFFAKSCEGMAIVLPEDTEGVEKVVTQEQWLVNDEEVSTVLEEAFEQGYEGIMLRDPEHLYDFKRSDALLKLKESDSDQSEEEITDCLVVGYTTESIPVIEDGKMIFKELINRLIVLQKDETECKVGSGFDLDFRYTVTENPDLIMNKVVEIKFQGYGNKGRMRFPRLFRVREDLTWGE
jgi:DNA ligase-1